MPRFMAFQCTVINVNPIPRDPVGPNLLEDVEISREIKGVVPVGQGAPESVGKYVAPVRQDKQWLSPRENILIEVEYECCRRQTREL